MIHADMFAFDMVEAPRSERETSLSVARASVMLPFLVLVTITALLLFALATRVEAFFFF